MPLGTTTLEIPTLDHTSFALNTCITKISTAPKELDIY